MGLSGALSTGRQSLGTDAIEGTSLSRCRGTAATPRPSLVLCGAAQRRRVSRCPRDGPGSLCRWDRGCGCCPQGTHILPWAAASPSPARNPGAQTLQGQGFSVVSDTFSHPLLTNSRPLKTNENADDHRHPPMTNKALRKATLCVCVSLSPSTAQDPSHLSLPGRGHP